MNAKQKRKEYRRFMKLYSEIINANKDLMIMVRDGEVTIDDAIRDLDEIAKTYTVTNEGSK